VAAAVFAGEELESLRRFPETGREELFRFFTLPPADSAFIDPGRGRGPADRLGLAVAVCTQELQFQLDALEAHGIPRDKIFCEKVSTRAVRPKFEAALVFRKRCSDV
jgi:hypothetical protein